MSASLHAPSPFGATATDSLSVLIDFDDGPLGALPDHVVSAVRRFTGLQLGDPQFEIARYDDYEVQAREQYAELERGDPSGRDSLLFAVYLSTYFHELRHVHDLLSTTYGQEGFFHLFNHYQNTGSLLEALTDWSAKGDGRRIPLPVAGDAGLWGELPQPLHELLRRDRELTERLEDMNRRRSSVVDEVQVVHLLEASAVSAQLGFLNDVFGYEVPHRVTEFMRDSGGQRVYLDLRSDMVDTFFLAGHRDERSSTTLNYLIWCSLTGASATDGDLASGPHPTVLFRALHEHVLHRCKELDFGAVREAVDEFCQEWGLRTPNENADHYSNVCKRRLADYEKKSKEIPNADKWYGVYASVTNTRAKTRKTILDLGEAYFSPGAYGWMVLQRALPAVHVKVRLRGEISDVMSQGSDVQPPEDWAMLAAFASTYQLLMKGRYRARPRFLEDIVFDRLVETGWRRGAPLRFRVVRGEGSGAAPS